MCPAPKCNIGRHNKDYPRLCAISYLEKHPLLGILGGQPLAICLTASLLHKNSLVEIYEMLISDKLFQD